MNTQERIHWISLLGFLFLFLCGSLTVPVSQAAEGNRLGVLLVSISFEDERWKSHGVTVLPCDAPSSLKQIGELKPTPGYVLISMVGKDKKPLRNYTIRNPRFILIEDPKEVPPLLSKVKFNLRLPVMEGVEAVEFWDDPQTGGRADIPTLIIPVKEALDDFERKGGMRMKAPCQEPEYRPDQRDKKKD
jgi:hypothetical protein